MSVGGSVGLSSTDGGRGSRLFRTRQLTPSFCVVSCHSGIGVSTTSTLQVVM